VSSRSEQRPNDRVVAQPGRGRLEIEVEPADAASALHDMYELLPMRQVRPQKQVAVATLEELEHSRVAADHDRTSIGGGVDLFDARDRTSSEVGEHGLPVECAMDREAQEQAAVRNEPIRFSAPCAECPRRLSKHFAAGAVELTHTAKARREGDLGNGQIGVVEEATGEVDPSAACKPVRRHPEVRREEAAKMT
jgi:hypothetical protein